MPYEKDKAGKWWYLYPSKEARVRCGTYSCDRCGKRFHRIPSLASQAKDGISKFCSRRCSNQRTAEIHRVTRRGPGNPAGWSGGRKICGGYAKVWRPTHPSADKRGWVPEHHEVMEKKIGRFLLPNETVHHKNGVTDDNHRRNLELWASMHPAGQRVKDLVVWAKEILKRYAKGNISQ